jgi:rhomboid protease GluP
MTLRQREVLAEPSTSPSPAPPRRPSLSPRKMVATWAFIGVCVLIFAADAVSGRTDLIGRLLLFGPLVAAGEWWRLASNVLVHGSALHIGLNMWVLHSLGRELEPAIGTRRFLATSLVSAIGASLVVMLFSFESRTVGASGMILGYGAAILLNATAEGRRAIGGWLLQIALISFLPGIGARISWEAHLGGFLFGLPCGFLLRKGARIFDRYIGWVIAATVVLTIAIVELRTRGMLDWLPTR